MLLSSSLSSFFSFFFFIYLQATSRSASWPTNGFPPAVRTNCCSRPTQKPCATSLIGASFLFFSFLFFFFFFISFYLLIFFSFPFFFSCFFFLFVWPSSLHSDSCLGLPSFPRLQMAGGVAERGARRPVYALGPRMLFTYILCVIPISETSTYRQIILLNTKALLVCHNKS